ncbi:MAG TPA: hypothetical protein VJL84_00670 [Kiloniellales bacterium]|nr:hypothetical protein [Kiloniellales bacterium]
MSAPGHRCGCSHRKVGRRRALTLLAAGAAAPLLPAAPALALPRTAGCSLAQGQLAEFNSYGYGDPWGVIESSGDPALDRALGKALVRLSGLFGQRPGFGFFDDYGMPNAYATYETTVPGTWGTVLYGMTLFRQLVQGYADEGMAVMMIAAHEFGHIAQYAGGADQQLQAGHYTVKPVELHADWLAGWYLGMRKRDRPDLSLTEAGRFLYSIGDYMTFDYNHHGTPDERVAAAEGGFKHAEAGGTDFGTAFREGMDRIRSWT